MAQAYLPGPPFEIGDVNLVDSRMLGQVELSPTSLLAELSNPFSDLDTYIKGHAPSIDLVHALYLVDALSEA